MTFIDKLIKHFYGEGEMTTQDRTEIQKQVKNGFIIPGVLYPVLAILILWDDLPWTYRLIDLVLRLGLLILISYWSLRTSIRRRRPDYVKPSKEERIKSFRKNLALALLGFHLYSYIFPAVATRLREGRDIWSAILNPYPLLFWLVVYIFIYLIAKANIKISDD